MDTFADMNVEIIMSDNPFEDDGLYTDVSSEKEENLSNGFTPIPETFQDNPFETEADSLKPDTKEETEDKKRMEHEAAEARRKEEWEHQQQEKKAAEKAQLDRIMAMSDTDLMSESMKKISVDTEKLTRRNMKECVSEYIQTLCLEDMAFARQIMLPQKNMIRCFQYINRKAYEYVQDEMKAAGIQPSRDTPCYSSDIPDKLCYHWAEEYFRTMDVKEDREDEDKFVPKPYAGTTTASSKGKKTGIKKSTTKKATEKKPEKKNSDANDQMSCGEQLSLENFLTSEKKAG